MLLTEVTKIVIAPRRQARKELISPNLGALCAFARDTIFPISSSIQNFKYLWLAFCATDNIRQSKAINITRDENEWRNLGASSRP